MDDQQIRSSEDAFVDLLFSEVPRFGAPFLCATKPRAFLDLNRAVEELDPALIEDVKPRGLNPRIASGLGVIPRVVANGRAIYSGKLTRDEAQHRIDTYWRPYHAELENLLRSAHESFGRSILIDCHSMPHEAVASMPSRRGALPEVVLGDRFGSSASADIMDQAEAAFKEEGLSVARNAPFAGAYITQTYGRPSRGQHAIQVELDRSLYMDEQAVRPNANFEQMKVIVTRVCAKLVNLGIKDRPLAAE